MCLPAYQMREEAGDSQSGRDRRSKSGEMLLWTPIVVSTLILAAAMWWLWRDPAEQPSASMPPVESQLLRLLGLFEVELNQGEGDCKVLGPSSDGKALILSFDHQESVLSLPDLLRFAKVRGHQLHELVQELVEFLQENQSRVGDLPFDLAIPDLLPQIRTMDWIQSNSPVFGPARLLRSPLLEDLRICYVIDESDTMVFLTEAHLASWGASIDAIHNLAMKNLTRKDAAQGLTRDLDVEEEALRVIEDGDGYTATRLLLTLYSGGPHEGVVFGIPERDKLYCGICDELPDHWREQLASDHAQGRHPLSPVFFRVENQQLVPL